VFVIFNVVIGGIGSFEGPIVGTIVYFVLRQYLSGLGAWHLILLGSSSIAIIVIEKRGVVGLASPRSATISSLLYTGHRLNSRMLGGSSDQKDETGACSIPYNTPSAESYPWR
jgi:branched-chain amino acid transport system permease protein